MGVTANELSIGVGEYPVILASLGWRTAEVLSFSGSFPVPIPPRNGQLERLSLNAAFHIEPFSDGKRSRWAVKT